MYNLTLSTKINTEQHMYVFEWPLLFSENDFYIDCSDILTLKL